MAARSSGAHPVLPRGFGYFGRSGRLLHSRRDGREFDLAKQPEGTREGAPPDCEVEASRIPMEVRTPAGKHSRRIGHRFGAHPHHSE